MEITYKWIAHPHDPKAPCSVTMHSKFIPRIGEFVDLAVDVSNTQSARKCGRVQDVSYLVRTMGSEITVILA